METAPSHIRIAIDAVGGDFAPRNVIAGSLDALREANNRFEVLFVGPERLIASELNSAQHNGLTYGVIDAPEVIDMHDSATAALREKKNSSISIGMTLHKEGKADAFVSAGHSGAVMSASTLILGRIEGVGRPTIGAFFPSERGVCLLLDAGANVDCRPQHLYEFAVMGSIYCGQMFGIQNPTVGLLSIGEEPSKGNEVVKETHKLLSQSKLNFIGNVEGRDILQGKAQVVVCDGFVGNIILKFGESVPSFFKNKLKQYTEKSVFGKLIGLMMRNTLRSAFKSMDYEEHGGVPVLGVNGVSIIGHGKSSPKAIKNMVLKAEEVVKKRINFKIQEALAGRT
ncbi:MAG TPA: phosphate acyltransferase PlsX [Bacteroidota bacterium]|nr:phosphate acyltransferase PlsX [Bacteroidota bacterium]